MNIRLYNARILTMVCNQSIFEGEIWIKNHKIFFLGSKSEAEIKLNHEVRITWER